MTRQPPETGTSYGSGVPIRAFREDARNLCPEDFEDRHGSAFLLLAAAELRRPVGPATTQIRLLGMEDHSFEHTANLALVAFPLRHTGRSIGHLVTVGRTANNDVVIPDVSISRFHAFLKQEKDGRFQIQDANSTNGTTLNSSAVPAQGQGPPMDLKPGDNLRFGQVELTFLSAAELQGFVSARES